MHPRPSRVSRSRQVTRSATPTCTRSGADPVWVRRAVFIATADRQPAQIHVSRLAPRHRPGTPLAAGRPGDHRPGCGHRAAEDPGAGREPVRGRGVPHPGRRPGPGQPPHHVRPGRAAGRALTVHLAPGCGPADRGLQCGPRKSRHRRSRRTACGAQMNAPHAQGAPFRQRRPGPSTRYRSSRITGTTAPPASREVSSTGPSTRYVDSGPARPGPAAPRPLQDLRHHAGRAAVPHARG